MTGSIVHTHDAVNHVADMTDQDRIRYTAYCEGMRAMRDKIATDLAYVAEGAPSRDAADYIWKYIMTLKGRMIQ